MLASIGTFEAGGEVRVIAMTVVRTMVIAGQFVYDKSRWRHGAGAPEMTTLAVGIDRSKVAGTAVGGQRLGAFTLMLVIVVSKML